MVKRPWKYSSIKVYTLGELLKKKVKLSNVKKVGGKYYLKVGDKLYELKKNSLLYKRYDPRRKIVRWARYTGVKRRR